MRLVISVVFFLVFFSGGFVFGQNGNVNTTHRVNGIPTQNFNGLGDNLELFGGGTFDLPGGWLTVDCSVNIYRWSSFPFPLTIYGTESKQKVNTGLPDAGAFAVFGCEYEVQNPVMPYYLTHGVMYYTDLAFSVVLLDVSDGSFSLANAGGIGE